MIARNHNANLAYHDIQVPAFYVRSARCARSSSFEVVERGEASSCGFAVLVKLVTGLPIPSYTSAEVLGQTANHVHQSSEAEVVNAML